jgi:hypothetical protein
MTCRTALPSRPLELVMRRRRRYPGFPGLAWSHHHLRPNEAFASLACSESESSTIGNGT